jgi:hypothetical protein
MSKFFAANKASPVKGDDHTDDMIASPDGHDSEVGKLTILIDTAVDLKPGPFSC